MCSESKISKKNQLFLLKFCTLKKKCTYLYFSLKYLEETYETKLTLKQTTIILMINRQKKKKATSELSTDINLKWQENTNVKIEKYNYLWMLIKEYYICEVSCKCSALSSHTLAKPSRLRQTCGLTVASPCLCLIWLNWLNASHRSSRGFLNTSQDSPPHPSLVKHCCGEPGDSDLGPGWGVAQCLCLSVYLFFYMEGYYTTSLPQAVSSPDMSNQQIKQASCSQQIINSSDLLSNLLLTPESNTYISGVIEVLGFFSEELQRKKKRF